MKTRYRFACLLAILIASGCTTADSTKSTTLDVESFVGVRSLRKFSGTNCKGFADKYIFGMYSSPFELTGGHKFHFLPDGCFFVEDFCDIGVPATLASGSWKLSGDVLLVSDVIERKSPRPLGVEPWVTSHFGSITRFNLFEMAATGPIKRQTILVPDHAIKRGPHVKGSEFIQRTEYNGDWPKTKERLLKQ